MKKIGVLSSDAKLLLEMLEVLKSEEIPFEIIRAKQKIPGYIGVVLTTEQDRDDITFSRVVVCSSENVTASVREAKAALSSRRGIRLLVIGIDPGRYSGIAVLADESLVETARVDSPEAVVDMVNEFTRVYPCESVLIRIGHGDRTRRNRIFNALWDLGFSIEIADERNTSTSKERKDIDAAIEIAHTPGYSPRRRQLVEPSRGEISDIQRMSRIQSDGALTISRSLAASVAKGELTMEEAIEQQRSGKNGGREG